MVEFTLEAAPILGGINAAIGANRIVERSDLAMVSVAIPQGGDAAMTLVLQSGWSLSMPEPSLSTLAGETRAVRTAPDQMMLIFPQDGPAANSAVQAKLNGAGYATDQTDVWAVLEVAGPDTAAALARICPLDIDPTHFPKNATGRTLMERMGALIIRVDDDRFLLLSASSSAGSFLHAVETSYKYVV